MKKPDTWDWTVVDGEQRFEREGCPIYASVSPVGFGRHKGKWGAYVYCVGSKAAVSLTDDNPSLELAKQSAEDQILLLGSKLSSGFSV